MQKPLDQYGSASGGAPAGATGGGDDEDDFDLFESDVSVLS